MRQIKDNEENQDNNTTTDNAIIVIPVKGPLPRSETDKLFLRDAPTYHATSNYEQSMVENSRISIHSTGNTPQETIDIILEDTGIEMNDDLVRVSECAAFWRAAGADTLIYCCSIGVTLVANGLIIRFLNFNALYSTLIFGGAGAISYNNVQILFNNLLKPPKESIPEDRQSQYAALNRYALLPLGFIVKSAVGGSILSALGDTSIGTQQAISSGTGPIVGPVMAGIRTGVRKCIGGSLILTEGEITLSEAFGKAYSSSPNPKDNNRSTRFGTINSMIAKVTGVTAATLGLWYSGGFKIESYCIPGQNVTNPVTFPDDCIGGNITFMFRELGISFGYAVGFMVIEPLMVAVTNRIYDFFYPTTPDTDDNIEIDEFGGDDRIVELDSDDPETK